MFVGHELGLGPKLDSFLFHKKLMQEMHKIFKISHHCHCDLLSRLTSVNPFYLSQLYTLRLSKSRMGEWEAAAQPANKINLRSTGLGLVMNILGGIIYTYIKHREKTKQMVSNRRKSLENGINSNDLKSKRNSR